ncbi:hypothetical protein [Streptomyces sp. NPDC002537]
MIRKTAVRRTGVVVSLVLAGATAASVPASAAPASVPFLCRVQENGQWSQYGSNRAFDVTAPATVHPNERFTVKYGQGTLTLNPAYQKEVRDMAVKVKLPSGTRLVGYHLSGGKNLGDSRQSVVVDGDQLTLKASGPFYGGQTFELPAIEAQVTAPATGTLVTSAGGTGFDDPGLSLRTLDTAINDFKPAQCYPDPAKPVQLSSTQVR